jgi:hypothetical protein
LLGLLGPDGDQNKPQAQTEQQTETEEGHQVVVVWWWCGDSLWKLQWAPQSSGQLSVTVVSTNAPTLVAVATLVIPDADGTANGCWVESQGAEQFKASRRLRIHDTLNLLLKRWPYVFRNPQESAVFLLLLGPLTCRIFKQLHCWAGHCWAGQQGCSTQGREQSHGLQVVVVKATCSSPVHLL